MIRLYLTDEQAISVKRALTNQLNQLYKCAEEMHNDHAYEIEEKYLNEANILDNVLDVIDYSSTRKKVR